jgi:hypothetical protein
MIKDKLIVAASHWPPLFSASGSGTASAVISTAAGIIEYPKYP